MEKWQTRCRQLGRRRCSQAKPPAGRPRRRCRKQKPPEWRWRRRFSTGRGGRTHREQRRRRQGSRGRITPIAVTPAWRPLRTNSGHAVRADGHPRWAPCRRLL